MGQLKIFFKKQVQDEFFDASFSKRREIKQYFIGMLSSHSISVLEKELSTLQKTFSELQEADSKVATKLRRNVGLFIAFRPWELSTLSGFKR